MPSDFVGGEASFVVWAICIIMHGAIDFGGQHYFFTSVTARTIHTAAPDKATSIGLKFFNTFKESPGAYTNFRSFMKQVHRTLSTFKTQF